MNSSYVTSHAVLVVCTVHTRAHTYYIKYVTLQMKFILVEAVHLNAYTFLAALSRIKSVVSILVGILRVI